MSGLSVHCDSSPCNRPTDPPPRRTEPRCNEDLAFDQWIIHVLIPVPCRVTAKVQPGLAVSVCLLYCLGNSWWTYVAVKSLNYSQVQCMQMFANNFPPSRSSRPFLTQFVFSFRASGLRPNNPNERTRRGLMSTNFCGKSSSIKRRGDSGQTITKCMFYSVAFPKTKDKERLLWPPAFNTL